MEWLPWLMLTFEVAGILLENSPSCIADVATHMLPVLRQGQQQKSESHQKFQCNVTTNTLKIQCSSLIFRFPMFFLRVSPDFPPFPGWFLAVSSPGRCSWMNGAAAIGSTGSLAELQLIWGFVGPMMIFSLELLFIWGFP